MPRRPVMIGTSFETRGGIASVVNVYRATGFLERHGVVYLASHCDGPPRRKLPVYLRAVVRFCRMLGAGEVALLHLHLSKQGSTWRKLSFAWAAAACGVPTIVHLHSGSYPTFYEASGPILRRLIRSMFHRAAAVVALSQVWADWLATITANPRILVLPNPVVVPPPTPWATRTANVLALGRIAPTKGSFDLVAAFSRARRAEPSARLRIGGDGDAEGLARAAAVLGIDGRVDLLGWVVGADKARELASARLFALPSYHEGLPMGLLEAMAAGLPVLTCPVGGIGEAVDDGVEGFLVAPGDVPALERRLWQLLTDPALAERMGAAARVRIERQFSVEVVLPRLDALYREIGRC